MNSYIFKENIDEATPLSVSDDLVRADWYRAGEGFNGDYNPDDPEDEELLRFDVYVNANFGTDKAPEWTAVDDASYCTANPVTTPMKELKEKLLAIFNEYRNVIKRYPIEVSVRGLGESLSWI